MYQQIAARLESIQEEITKACQRAGRHADEVTLIGVTKTYPSEVVQAAREAGLRDFGENKVQELVEKSAVVPGIREGGDVRWHMIGHLQRNKAREVIRHADLFHALDSLRLAAELDLRAAAAQRVMPCLIEVNVSGEDSKFGISPAQLPDFIDQLTAYAHLHIVGLMTIASPVSDPERVRPEFRKLRSLLEAVSRTERRTMQHLSMGMSGDFAVAIEEGATLIRVGTAIFGTRI